MSRKQCGEIFWHGGNHDSGGNRWFDKSVQIMCANNGKAGLLGEHSMLDGMPMVGLADHIVKTTYQDVQEKSDGSSFSLNSDDVTAGVENIFESDFDAMEANSYGQAVDVGKALTFPSVAFLHQNWTTYACFVFWWNFVLRLPSFPSPRTSLSLSLSL